MYQATLLHELVSMPDGNVRLNLWIGEYDGFSDEGLFLLKDRQGMLDETPIYASACNPVNMVEYPLGQPEGPRGYFRSGRASLCYASEALALAAKDKIAERVAITVAQMNRITDPTHHLITPLTTGDRTLTLTHNRTLRGSVYMKMVADIPCFLVMESPTMGSICKGVCTPAEMSTIGTMVGADNGWRVDTMELITYANLFADVLGDTLDRLRLL